MSRRKIRLLYVDEKSKNLNGFFLYFKIYKEFVIHLADSLDEGLEIFSSMTLHVIIIADQNVAMEFLERMPNRQNGPVKIMLASSGSKTEIKKAMKKSFIFFYHKQPCNFAKLKATIDKAYRAYCDNSR